MPKSDNDNTRISQWHCCSVFINKFEQIEYPLVMFLFAEFEQVNVYLWKFDVWSLKLFDSFILIYCNCEKGDGN